MFALTLNHTWCCYEVFHFWSCSVAFLRCPPKYLTAGKITSYSLSPRSISRRVRAVVTTYCYCLQFSYLPYKVSIFLTFTVGYRYLPTDHPPSYFKPLLSWSMSYKTSSPHGVLKLYFWLPPPSQWITVVVVEINLPCPHSRSQLSQIFWLGLSLKPLGWAF